MPNIEEQAIGDDHMNSGRNNKRVDEGYYGVEMRLQIWRAALFENGNDFEQRKAERGSTRWCIQIQLCTYILQTCTDP